MDFPVNLGHGKWVSGLDELKQNINLLLKNSIGAFYQDSNLGAHFSIHSSNEFELEEGVKRTLEQIPYITVKQISVNLPTISVSIEYNREIINFQYRIEV